MTAALIVLLAAGHVLGLAHLLLVQHSRCAEHGELIDVRDGKGRAVAARPGSAGAQLTQAPLAESDHHDHCAAVPQRQEQGAAVSPRSAQVGALPVTASLDRLQPAGVRAPQALYRLAPKTSPPV